MKDFIEKIKRASSIAILGHMRPDGDCIGSCLGLYNYITDNFTDKQVVVFLQDIPEKFRFLKGADKIAGVMDKRRYELAISLDCGDTDRHAEFADIFRTAEDTICIDHHRSNEGFGNYYYCDPDASSTAECVCRHLDMSLIGRAAAEAFYCGIVHDTGVFKYPSTNEDTMKCAGALISKGVRTQYIIDETFYKVSIAQSRLSGRALLEARMYCDNKVVATCVTKEMFEEYGAIKADTEGIVDKIRVIDGVEVAVFAYQLDEELYKFSLRSIEYVDVSKIAVAHGGGGHYRAAGFEMRGDYEQCLKTVIDMIEEQL